jgi:hypothetical protein
VRVGIIGWQRQETNPELVHAWREAGIDALASTTATPCPSLPGGDVYVDAAAGLGICGTSVGGDVRHLSA